MDKEAVVIYIVVMPILMFLKGKGYMKQPQSIQYCMADIVCNMEHYTKGFMCIMALLLLMNELKGYFRAGVILRYHNSVKLYWNMLKRIGFLSAAMAVYQTVIAVVIGISLAQYQCNWNMYEGAPYHIMGNIVDFPVDSVQIILIYTYTVFFTVFVSGVILCTAWCAAMTPIMGFLCVIILLTVETGVNIYVNVFYSILDMKPVQMYMFGAFHMIHIILPLVYIMVLSAAGIFVLSKREYMRVK